MKLNNDRSAVKISRSVTCTIFVCAVREARSAASALARCH